MVCPKICKPSKQEAHTQPCAGGGGLGGEGSYKRAPFLQLVPCCGTEKGAKRLTTSPHKWYDIAIVRKLRYMDASYVGVDTPFRLGARENQKGKTSGGQP